MDEAKKLATFTGRSVAEITLTFIPVFGAPLGAACTALELASISRRLDKFFRELEVTASRLDAEKIDHAYLETDAFVDVVIAGLEAARRTTDRGKHQMIAAVLIGAATVDHPQPIDVEDVLVVLRDLGPAALAMMRQIHEQAKGQPVGSIMTAVVPPSVPDRDFLLNRLVAAGFIREMKINDYSPYIHYQPTDTFLRMVRLMESGGWMPDPLTDV